MRIVHVTTSIDNTHGGIARSVSQLIRAMFKHRKIDISLYCLESAFPLMNSLKKYKGVVIFCQANKIGYSKQLNELLDESNIGLFHGHGIWQLPVHQMAKKARKNQIPYIIAPRGMLETWSLKQSQLKKRIGLKLFQFNDLRHAACIQATAPMEARSIRAMGLDNPIAVIPNGVPLNKFPLKQTNGGNSIKKILFLSRIHQKKGIELLIEAWSQIDMALRNGWEIDIVGNGDERYIRQLNSLILAKGLSDSIKIKEPLYNGDKVKAYQDAQLFILPSYSENFGIVVAEALACGTPVITTQDTPWQDLVNHDCGWWVETGVESIKEAISEALCLPPEKLVDMGKSGRKLVENKYSMDLVVEKTSKLYKWILDKGEKPDFVLED